MQTIDLETFLAVADSGSFSRAAESLHITQPAVTKRIQNLENRLNTRLFDRIGKRVYLTDGGALLLPRARSLLAGMADTERLLRNLDSRIEGSLRLATSHHVGLHRLAPVLRAYSRAHPAVSLDIRFEDSEAAHELVRRTETELAVVTLNPAGDPELDCVPVWDDPLCFVVAADHPLVGRSGGALSLQELARHPVVLPGMATYTGRIVADLFESRDIALNPTLSTNFLETISMLVGIGLGWSVLPASMVGESLIALETNAPPLRRQLGHVTHPQRTASNAASAFLGILRDHADPEHASGD
ncbi:MAG: LysR family transcriptional regulator [Pseudomonadales bacterium]